MTGVYRQLVEQQKHGKLAISMRGVREAIDLAPLSTAEAQQVLQQAVKLVLTAAGWCPLSDELFCQSSLLSAQPGHSWRGDTVCVRALADVPDSAVLVIRAGPPSQWMCSHHS